MAKTVTIDVSRTFRTLNGQTMKDNDGSGNAVDATLKVCIVNALLSNVERETGTEKIKKYKLAMEIYNAESTVEFTKDEVSLIKKRVGEVYPPLIVGQVEEMLDGSL